MICLTTILGYLGKYGMNFFLDSILKNLYGENYNKKKFMNSILIAYFISLVYSYALFMVFKYSIFEINPKKGDNSKTTVKISQICGYIIYSQEKKRK